MRALKGRPAAKITSAFDPDAIVLEIYILLRLFENIDICIMHTAKSNRPLLTFLTLPFILRENSTWRLDMQRQQRQWCRSSQMWRGRQGEQAGQGCAPLVQIFVICLICSSHPNKAVGDWKCISLLQNSSCRVRLQVLLPQRGVVLQDGALVNKGVFTLDGTKVVWNCYRRTSTSIPFWSLIIRLGLRWAFIWNIIPCFFSIVFKLEMWKADKTDQGWC